VGKVRSTETVWGVTTHIATKGGYVKRGEARDGKSQTIVF